MTPLRVGRGPGHRPVELLTATDVGRLLGVSRQRVSQLAATPGFPEPIGTLGRSRIWRRPDIERWAATTDRPIHNEDTIDARHPR